MSDVGDTPRETAPAADLTCKEVARILSAGQDRALPEPERARLRLHLVVCGACHNVEQQFDFIRRAMRSLGKDSG
jgi:hypothetical protein